jgi:rubrerythrin
VNDADLHSALEDLRRSEKQQAVHYRALAAMAEASGDQATAQRLHDLHADEQHHLSRLTARLVELGRTAVDLPIPPSASADLRDWEAAARLREGEEVERYRQFIERDPDPTTRALAEQILEVEIHHRDELAGKWTIA